MKDVIHTLRARVVNHGKRVLLLSALFAIITGLLLFAGCANIKSTKHYEDGKRYAKSEQYDRAIKEFELALRYNPKHDQAMEALGLIYGKLGMYDRALPYFEKAYSLKPEDKLYITNLAVTYEKNERFTDAKKAYMKLLTIDKDNKLARKHFRDLEEKGY